MDGARDAQDRAAPDDPGDAAVSLFILAGIAAADVLCCRFHGEHARGDSHQQAVQLLAAVVPDGKALSNCLDRLLGMKTKAEYAADAVSADDVRRAERAAAQLVSAAERAEAGSQDASANPT